MCEIKVNSKDTRTTSLANFPHCSGVSIADIELVNAGWLNYK